jgi:hypothetical protein
MNRRSIRILDQSEIVTFLFIPREATREEG